MDIHLSLVCLKVSEALNKRLIFIANTQFLSPPFFSACSVQSRTAERIGNIFCVSPFAISSSPQHFLFHAFHMILQHKICYSVWGQIMRQVRQSILGTQYLIVSFTLWIHLFMKENICVVIQPLFRHHSRLFLYLAKTHHWCEQRLGRGVTKHHIIYTFVSMILNFTFQRCICQDEVCLVSSRNGLRLAWRAEIPSLLGVSDSLGISGLQSETRRSMQSMAE